eukprot:scaffold270_cov347-Pavlova_lutheri.AAC.44
MDWCSFFFGSVGSIGRLWQPTGLTGLRALGAAISPLLLRRPRRPSSFGFQLVLLFEARQTVTSFSLFHRYGPLAAFRPSPSLAHALGSSGHCTGCTFFLPGVPLEARSIPGYLLVRRRPLPWDA